jgi:hypothetical protein
LKKYQCGRCTYGSDDLEEFGAHICVGANPMLAALGGVISTPWFTIDLTQAVKESIEQHRVQAAVDGLEDALRRGEL